MLTQIIKHIPIIKLRISIFGKTGLTAQNLPREQINEPESRVNRESRHTLTGPSEAVAGLSQNTRSKI